MKNTKLIIIILIICMLFSVACSAKENIAQTLPLRDDTLLLAIEDQQKPKTTFKDTMYIRDVKEIDYNVYNIYLRVYPTYDNRGYIITRKAYENFVPRSRSYNPDLNCTIWFSESGPLDTSSLQKEEGMDATIRVRGNSSRGNPIKNFKVKLPNAGDRIFGADSLNINKHFVDETRTINKACMDIMRLIPEHFVSMETKFIHLYISDVDESGKETGFIDQGIYTYCEQPNKDFLVRHGLDPNGSIYKAMAFEFLKYENELRSEDDPLYDAAKYEEVIKPTANGNHDKLRAMIDDVNNYSLEFDKVMEKHFDEDNYLTWMALNILLGNIDTLSHNFLIYSPSDSDKWYMMPWDFDGSLNDYSVTDMGINNYQSFGVHFYWTIPLHQRYFRIAGNLEKLNARINEINNSIMTKENLQYIQSKTINIATPFIKNLTGNKNKILAELVNRNPNLLTDVDTAINKWYQSIQDNYTRYFLNLDNPTSGNALPPTFENDEWVFRWDASYDFQHDKVSYDFFLATDADFENIVASENDLNTPIFRIDELPKGHLYFQYIAKDSNGNVQYPLNRLSIKDIDGNTLVRKRGVGYYDNGSGDVYVIENEIFGDDMAGDNGMITNTPDDEKETNGIDSINDESTINSGVIENAS